MLTFFIFILKSAALAIYLVIEYYIVVVRDAVVVELDGLIVRVKLSSSEGIAT